MSGDESKGASLQAQTQAFLRDIFSKGEELVRELIDENERLRRSLSVLPPDDPDQTKALVQRLMKQVEELEAECAKVRSLAGDVQQESGHYRQRLETLEREHYGLAAMYVAGGQFHMANTLDEVLRTVTELLLNFVGVGCFTVFGVDEERNVLFPLMRVGADDDTAEDLPLPKPGQDDSTPLGRALQTPTSWKQLDSTSAEAGVLMYLPLVSGPRLVGVARIERFLPQKHAFTENDVGLLELISEHSGIGIETAWIRAHAQEVPFARRGLEKLVVA